MDLFKDVVIDTNFFMIPFQLNVDVINELEKTLPSYRLTTTNFIIDELVGLSKNKKNKNRINAKLALKIANSPKIFKKNISLEDDESVDNALIRISQVLATNDKELRIKARKKGITVIYLRQKRYLSIDGHV
ncbi:type II toxin-antitoxin system VapC family toxin [Methanobrevibacter filiformis]|uniref:Fcf1 n=1 Tax=Methanobrevibacter filiformis TaxID=55758 RepID=A0A165ZGL9_9EURY|nr:PIN domain-containing protein [Methanobrevibacter filiformis]KZX10683.1 Fcf1 [Methanobrevibacter filiformis]